MRRVAFGLFLLPTLLAMPARAQNLFVGGGSTPAGDYLRGVGIEAWGAGLYNLNTAQAYSITVDADIRLNTYLSAVFRAERDNYQKLVQQRMAKEDQAYKDYKARVRDKPNDRDVLTGNALNTAFEQINDPSIQESSRGSVKVPLSLDVVRRVPFRLDQKNQIFSIQRLTARGKGKWPVAFQEDKFKPAREAYEKAIDKALDQMIDGKMLQQTIKDYKDAVWGLRNQMEREFGDSNSEQIKEAWNRLHDMENAAKLLEISKIQAVMAGIDRYNGKTVDDLRAFMREHNLKFGEVDYFNQDEMKLYVELYEKIDQMRTVVVGTPGGKDR